MNIYNLPELNALVKRYHERKDAWRAAKFAMMYAPYTIKLNDTSITVQRYGDIQQAIIAEIEREIADITAQIIALGATVDVK